METSMELALRAAKDNTLSAMCHIKEAATCVKSGSPGEEPCVRVVLYALSQADEAVRVAVREIEEYQMRL